MRSAAVLLACRAAGLAPSPTRRHALALLGGAAPAAADTHVVRSRGVHWTIGAEGQMRARAAA